MIQQDDPMTSSSCPRWRRWLRSPALKRLVDVTGAAAGLTVCSPVMLSIAALIRLQMGSPVLFRQRRGGYQGETIEILKFRTMRDAVDEQGHPLPDHERITALGQFLRRTSLDELPGLLNVLRGDLSLVGPRPLLERYLPRYNDEQRRRHDVKPGITGWAQINGRNAISWEEKFDLDVWYVDHWDVLLDLEILAKTVLHALQRKDIDAGEQVTMPEFMGTATTAPTTSQPPPKTSPAPPDAASATARS